MYDHIFALMLLKKVAKTAIGKGGLSYEEVCPVSVTYNLHHHYFGY